VSSTFTARVFSFSRVILYCAIGGAPMLLGALGVGQWPLWWMSGIVMAAAFVPVALFGPRTLSAQFGTILLALVIIAAICTWSEALIFLPASDIREHPLLTLIGSCGIYVIAAAVLAALGRLLRLNRASIASPAHHRFVRAAMTVALSGAAYVVYYLVFGALTYQFMTKGYYPDAPQLVAGLGPWFWIIQFARGILMTLAIVPIIYTLRLHRWQTAIVAGLVMWIAGGLAPLLIPNPLMTPPQRLIHIVEIFTQNFPLGVTAARLLRT